MSEIDRRESAAGVYLGRNDTSLTLRPPDIVNLDHSYIRMPLELRGAGLAADGLLDLAGWGGWVVGFFAYFDDLAANWNGWKGVKVWSDDSAAVDLSATHNGMSNSPGREAATVLWQPRCWDLGARRGRADRGRANA